MEIRSSIVDRLGTVENKIRHVQEKFNLVHQVERHPLGMVGGSLIAGFIAGSFARFTKSIDSDESASTPPSKESGHSVYDTPDWRPAGSDSPAEGVNLRSRAARRAGFLSRLGSQFDEEIQMAKIMALDAGLSYLKKKLREKTPSLSGYVSELADSVHRKMNAAVGKSHEPSSEAGRSENREPLQAVSSEF